MINELPSKGLEWTNLVLGACLISSAFVFIAPPAAAWDAGTVGTLIACSSAAALYRYGVWAEWSNLALGCWAVIAPFLLGFGALQAPMLTHVLIGLCVATIAALQLNGSRAGQVPSNSRSDNAG